MKISEWVKASRIAVGLKQEDIAAALGRQKATVSGWENDKYEPSYSQMLRIYELTKRALPLPGLPPQDRLVLPSARSEVEIPQYCAAGSMGAGIKLRDQPGIIQMLSVNREWLEKNIRSHTGAKNLCLVTGFGDSMRPMYNPGDPLLMDRGVLTVEFDAVYFFRVGDEGFIKRLQRIPGEGLTAISENKAYKDWIISPDMDFEVFGRILKVWRSEDL